MTSRVPVVKVGTVSWAGTCQGINATARSTSLREKRRLIPRRQRQGWAPRKAAPVTAGISVGIDGSLWSRLVVVALHI